MNKNEFLRRLDMLLQSLPYDERRDIMYDYEEHFKSGLEDGKTEEEITRELGSPEKIASGYVPGMNRSSNSNYSSSVNNNATSNRDVSSSNYSVPLAIAMFFFNLIFVAGIYLGFWGALIGFLAAGFAICIASIAVFLGSILSFPVVMVTLPFSVATYPILGVLTSILLLSLGGLILIGSIFLVKGYANITVKYIDWNKKIVRG